MKTKAPVRILPVLKNHKIFLLIIFITAILRFYKIETLTTFGRDQGIDFLSVYEMLINNNLIFIGIKTSIGEFFQGPIYLYMLIPAFSLMKLNPIAGAYSAVIVSLVTSFLIYFVSLKFFNKKSAIISTLLFMVSPEFTKYGNTPLYQHFAPLFMLFSLLSFYFMIKNDSKLSVFLFAFFAGLAFETHLLFVTLVISGFIYLTLAKKTKQLALYIFGVLTSISPTILFELKNKFFNLTSLIDYLKESEKTNPSIVSKITVLLDGVSIFLAGESLFLALLVILFTILIVFKPDYNKFKNKLRILFIITIFISLIFSYFSKSLEPHYLLPVWVFTLLFLPQVQIKYSSVNLSKVFVILLICVNLFTSISNSKIDHGYNMPAGWSLASIKKTSELIATDSKINPNFNVASLLDGDTRSYPIRYFLLILNQQPDSVANYPNNDHLYVVANSKEDIDNTKTWEVVSHKPFNFGGYWKINDNIQLYRLDKIL